MSVTSSHGSNPTLKKLFRRIGNQWCKQLALSKANLHERGSTTSLLQISELKATFPFLTHVVPLAALIQKEHFDVMIPRRSPEADLKTGHLQNFVDFLLVRCPILDQIQFEELIIWPADSRWGIPGKYIDCSRILKVVFEERLTLVLTRADFRFSRLAAFVEDLSGIVHRLSNATLYWTPGTPSLFNSGFQPHEDDHCVVIVQLHGVKHWILWPSWGMRCRRFLGRCCGKVKQSRLKRKHTRRTSVRSMMPAARKCPFGKPWRQVTLRPGDMLYLPQGIPHAAWSSCDSLHLTVGLEDEFLFSWEGCVHVMIALSRNHFKSCSPRCQRAVHQLVVSAAKFGSLGLRRLLKLPIMLGMKMNHDVDHPANNIRVELKHHVFRKPSYLVCDSIIDIVCEKLQCVPQVRKVAGLQCNSEVCLGQCEPKDTLLFLLASSGFMKKGLEALKQAFEEQQQFRQEVRQANLTRVHNFDV